MAVLLMGLFPMLKLVLATAVVGVVALAALEEGLFGADFASASDSRS